MLCNTRRLLVGPLLAACVSGAFFVLDPASASAATAGTVRLNGVGSLKMRVAATATSAEVGSLPNNTAVAIVCKVTGQYISGSVRNTSQWDRLANGRYVSHAYIVVSRAVPTCPPAPVSDPTPPSGPLTTVSNAAFIAAAAGPARDSQREFRVPASVTIAQAILESGWGKSKLSMNDRNYFGMKCFGNPGPIAMGCHDYLTSECDAVKCWEIIDSFRVYRSVTDSFRDHGRQLASLSRYAPAFVDPSDANRFAYEIHRGGYATDPQYFTKLTRIMTQYNLYQYDVR